MPIWWRMAHCSVMRWCRAAMFNGKPRAGNSGNFPFPGKRAGNSRVSGIPDLREFSVSWEFPVPGNSRGTGISRTTGIPVPRAFPGNGHSRETGIPGKREIPVTREFPSPENFPPVSRETGNSREFPARGFPLNIAGIHMPSGPYTGPGVHWSSVVVEITP